ncbi:MAG: phage holin family protein [Defluviitaleaceae bacterium]|nr:phage holin family protein [Defluviitaleaceae bacterium]
MALLVMMGLDFITGVIKGIYLKEITSKKVFSGAVKKIGVLCIVAVANILDQTFDIDALLRSITIAYFMTGEALSVLENWGQMGLPIPKKLRGALKQLKDD